MALAALGTSCGYSLQTSHNELLDREGVRRIYVKPLLNNTYKPGVENVVYNALVRVLLSHGRVKVVSSLEDADAVLEGTVNSASFGVIASTVAASLGPASPTHFPAVTPGSNIDLNSASVASVYNAVLGCNFVLKRRDPPPGRKAIVWSGGFNRPKPFSSANQLDVPGTTSALINESEFEHALSDLASGMMEDLHESMLGMF